MWIKRMLFLVFIISGLQIINSERVVATEPVNIGSRRELLADDYLIERMSDSTRLELHHPVRREVVIQFDRPWEGNACGYATVIQEGDRYRLYYRGSNMQLTKGKITYTHPEVTCYAESNDGINWVRPDLGIVEYDGSKNNNIIVKLPKASHNFSPFLDRNPDCKAAEKFKALGGGGDGLYTYKSADGIHWSPLSKAAVIRQGAFDSQNLAFWDASRQCYVEYHRASRKGRDVMSSTSEDFQKWSKPDWLEYTPDRTTELYTNQIEPYYRAPHFYVGFPTRYVPGRGWYSSINETISKSNRRCGTDYTDIGFISSRDGENFKVWPEAFLRPGPSPELWMYGFGYTALGMVETKSNVPGGPNELSFYATDAGAWIGKGNSLCRYTLRLDGFVSATAPLSGGELTTKPLIFDGAELKINFETSVAGSIQVEIQDDKGKPVPGFTLAESPSLFGNSTDYAIEWNSKANLADLAGKPIRLRFVLKDADLYAFHFDKK